MINKVILTGRLTTDIDLRQTNDGIVYAYFTLAVTRSSNRNNTDFVPCIVWRQTAEFLNTYAKKGTMIGAEGRLEVFRLEQNGNYQTRVNVNVSQVHLLESKRQSDERTGIGLSFNNQQDNNSDNNNTQEISKINNKNDEKGEVNFDEIDFDEINF